MRASVLVAASLIVAGATAQAQTRGQSVPVVPRAADMSKWQSAMVAAEAAAIRPGDEALPCEALHKELVTSMTDSKLQALAAKSNPALAKEVAALEKNGAMTAETASAMAAALSQSMVLSGMGPMTMPPMPGGQMTPQQMQQLIEAQQQATITYMNQMAPIMPTLMRSQRVTVLAAMKNCAWATGGMNLYPSAVPPGSNPAIQRGLPQR